SAKNSRSPAARSGCRTSQSSGSGDSPPSTARRNSAITPSRRSSVGMVPSRLVAEPFPQSPEPAPQQTGHGRLRPPQFPSHRADRSALEVVQLDRGALVLRQRGQGVGQPAQLLLPDGVLARRGRVGPQERLHAGGGPFQGGLQRL